MTTQAFFDRIAQHLGYILLSSFVVLPLAFIAWKLNGIDAKIVNGLFVAYIFAFLTLFVLDGVLQDVETRCVLCRGRTRIDVLSNPIVRRCRRCGDTQPILYK